MIQRALVLEGGGLRGNYTAGVLDAFLDGGIEFPYIIGVSAGVGYGCSYASKQRGRNLEILKKYRRDPRYCSLRSFIKTGDLFGLDFIYEEIPRRLVPFDFDTFYQSPSRFVSVCTDCESGRAVYYEKGNDILRVMKASSALPYISKMVSYEGRKLLDGAIVDAIPLAKAIEAGYARTVTVLTQPEGYRKKEEPQPPSGLFYRRYPRLREAMGKRVASYNRALEFAEEEAAAGRTFLIQPSRDLGAGRAEKNVEKLIRLYELGVGDGARALEKIKQFAKDL
jgi:predicted patatin/cPLA2 family phospholipase